MANFSRSSERQIFFFSADQLPGEPCLQNSNTEVTLMQAEGSLGILPEKKKKDHLLPVLHPTYDLFGMQP